MSFYFLVFTISLVDLLCLQWGTTDAFEPSVKSPKSIDQNYVDGISVTYGSSPRKHVWTFAAGLTQTASGIIFNCPCALHPGVNPPSFVGNDYYCDSGNLGPTWYWQWYLSGPLWDGNCYAQSQCCNRTDLPFFVRKLAQTVKGPLEARLCSDQDTSSEEACLEMLQLFVR